MSSLLAFTILVVDDNPSSGRFVDLALGPSGVRVIGVAPGQSALATAVSERPNVAFVAAGLRGPNGQSIAEQLSQHGFAVALMEGSLGSAQETASTSLPALRKPLQVEALRDVVAHATRERRPAPPVPPQEFGTPLAIQNAAAPIAPPFADHDPVDAWLMTADAMFGPAPSHWRRLSLDGELLGPFARDLESFRAAPRPAGLQFSRHRTLEESTA